jgi:hypothetical protein
MGYGVYRGDEGEFEDVVGPAFPFLEEGEDYTLRAVYLEHFRHLMKGLGFRV